VWTNELAQLLFGAYAVLSGGYILAHGGHVNVDIIHSKFTVRTRAIIDVCTSIFFFLFAIVLLIQGSLFAFESIQKFESSQSAWNPSIWVFKAAIPVGAALLLLQGVVKLIQDIFLAAGRELPSDLRPGGHAAKKEAAGDVL
jgi:TRAP-type mannitol/chloroaromatic compound transport system permease small subunit